MEYSLAPSEITIRVTFDELVKWEHNDLCVYAIMSPVIAAYVASRPSWEFDWCLATVEDFLEAAGLDSLGLEEMTEKEYAHQAADIFTHTTSREG